MRGHERFKDITSTSSRRQVSDKRTMSLSLSNGEIRYDFESRATRAIAGIAS
jgi:hypothetical protein